MTHLDGLNEAQRQAVETTEGPVLVLAGAGSGKTRVITHRIIHLIEKGVAPHNILAVTFTNKAAKEMRERVETLIDQHFGANRATLTSNPPTAEALAQNRGAEAAPAADLGHGDYKSLPTVTTFHALGVRIIRAEHETLGLRRHFVIYDRSDQLKVVKAGLEKAGYSPKQFEPKKILSIISKAKGDAQSRSDFMAEASSFVGRVAGEIWEHYENVMKAEHALDFDDLLSKTMNLLKSNPVILEKYRKRFKYIHIDEYQDTNKVQYEISRLLVGEGENICVVGDVDQNIYSWRGADIKNILQFEKHFPQAKTIFLEENYRSTQTIIEASNNVIEKNINRPDKKVFTSNQAGDKIGLYTAMTGADEAQYVALTAQQLIEDGKKPSEIAVLYRTNFQSRVLEEAFINYGVPYQMLGTKFFDRKEVKDVLSFLRLALNPGSTADLSRIVNVPTRGIGKVTLLKLIEGKRDELKGATLAKVEAFDQIMMDIAEHARENPVHETIKFIMERTGLEKDLRKGGDEGLERLENLRELVSVATRYTEYMPEEAVERFMEDAALQSDQDELKNEEEQDAVRLMTVHASKGLEFPYVFITGLEEGLFPHERLDKEGIDDEEERRLFYVALTRAEKKVYLTFANMRTIFGTQKINVPSNFINDISSELIESDTPGGDVDGGGDYIKTVWL